MCASSAVCVLIVLQISHMVQASQFTIIPPKNPIIGFLGKDIILPCQLTTMNLAESIIINVQWMFVKSSEKLNVKTYDGKKHEETQDGRYQGRTELFDTELYKGNMSLKLKNSNFSDQGKYICMINLGNWYDEVIVELNITAKGEEPVIALVFHEGQGIGLTCSSMGWYPKPHILWLDSRGENRTEEADSTKTQQAPGGTFLASSSITIEQGADSEVSCKIINSVLQTESESRILISDVFYPRTSGWIAPFIIIFLLCLCLVAFVVYKLRQSYQNVSQSENRKNKGRVEQLRLNNCIESEKQTRHAGVAELQQRQDRLTAELGVRRSQSYAAAVTLDPDYKHPKVVISGNRKRALFQPSVPGKPETPPGNLMVVVKEGYAAGKHYWEVKVGERLDWELGVLTQAARDKAKKENFVGLLGEGCWALSSVRGDLSSNPDKQQIQKKGVPYSVIGMFLDQQDVENISFYNVSVGILFPICSIPIQSTEKLHPFLSFGDVGENKDQSPLEVINLRIPVPFKDLQ